MASLVERIRGVGARSKQDSPSRPPSADVSSWCYEASPVVPPSSSTGTIPGEAASSGTRTPPPTYGASLGSQPWPDRCTAPTQTSLGPTCSADTLGKARAELREESGISWTWATQGLELLRLCSQMPATTSPMSTSGAQDSPRRSLYVHAMTYLLRALPKDLSEQEQASIRTSVQCPTMFIDGSEPPVNAVGGPCPYDSSTGTRRRPQPYTLLHRLTASLFFNLVLLASLLLPILTQIYHALRTLVQHYHLYDRLCEVLLALCSLFAVQAQQLGRWAIGVYQKVNETSGAKTGLSVEQAFMVCALSIAGGLRDGIGQGLSAVQAAKEGDESEPVRMGGWGQPPLLQRMMSS